MAVFKKKIVKKVVKKKKILKPAKKLTKVKRPTKIVKAVKRVLKKKTRPLDLKRSERNPIINPISESYWESEGVFNPGVIESNGRIHLFYRALGPDGISRIGYASSADGINFDRRHKHPVYLPELAQSLKAKHPYTSPARLEYNRELYPSGGGWGGCEDPRTVKMNGRVYMTFNFFNGWYSICIGLTSISETDLERGDWRWSPLVFLSPQNQRHKNWALFSEKINDKYALFHNLHSGDPSQVCIEYLDTLDKSPEPFESPDPHLEPNRDIVWHNRMRSIGPPPVKTKKGWLAFYHAMDRNDPGRYKLGALLLDLDDPRKIICRSKYPILEPDEWYENDWKPGIIYASGAIIKDGTLLIYYGGGDKYIGVASANADEFVEKLLKSEKAQLAIRKSKVK